MGRLTSSVWAEFGGWRLKNPQGSGLGAPPGKTLMPVEVQMAGGERTYLQRCRLEQMQICLLLGFKENHRN